MTFPRKGTRKVQVDGETYNWRLKAYDAPYEDDAEGVAWRNVIVVQAESGGPVWQKTFENYQFVTPVMVIEAIQEKISGQPV